MPQELKRYFWDTKFEKLDIKQNRRAIKWLNRTHSKVEIIESIKNTRQLNKITANFLKNIYDLREEEMQYYINI